MSPAAATNLLRELTAIYDAVHGTRNSLLAIHALAKDDIGMGEINRPSVISALFECEAGALEAMRRQRGGEELNKNDLPGEIIAEATEGGAATARSGRPQLSHNLNRMKETFKEIKRSNDSIRQLAAVQNISVASYVRQMKYIKNVAEEGVKKEKRRRERQYEDDEGSEDDDDDDDDDDDEDNDDEDAMDEEDKRMQTQEDIPKKSKGKKKLRKAQL